MPGSGRACCWDQIPDMFGSTQLQLVQWLVVSEIPAFRSFSKQSLIFAPVTALAFTEFRWSTAVRLIWRLHMGTVTGSHKLS